jgi:hypothetical protein
MFDDLIFVPLDRRGVDAGACPGSRRLLCSFGIADAPTAQLGWEKGVIAIWLLVAVWMSSASHRRLIESLTGVNYRGSPTP